MGHSEGHRQVHEKAPCNQAEATRPIALAVVELHLSEGIMQADGLAG